MSPAHIPRGDGFSAYIDVYGIADRFGVPYRVAKAWTRRKTFPMPVHAWQMGGIWHPEDVSAWVREHVPVSPN